MKKNFHRIITIWEKHFSLFFCIFIVLFTLFLYRDYLVGNKVFVSTGDAMDLYDQFYPNLYNVAEHIENGNTNIQMDFTIGLGTEFNIGFPTFNNIPALFGTKNVAYLMGFVQILKVICAGIFSYFYFIVMGKKKYVAAIGAISYSFCGHMLVRQFWLSYATEVAVFAIWLLCCELWIMKKDFRWLPLGTFFLVVNLSSVYYIILYLLLCCAYIIFRYLYEGYFKEIKKYGLWSLLAVVSVSLFTYGFRQFLSGISSSVSSERFESGVTSISGYGEFWGNLKELFTLFARTVGVTILGSGKTYVGEADYLTAPTFYIGILCLIILIPVWLELKKRNKVLLLLAALAVAAYVFINPFRRIVNGYADENYKLSSFWILVLGIYVVVQGLDMLLQNMKRYQLLIILTEVFIIELVGAWAITSNYWAIDNKMMLFTMAAAGIYLLVLQWNYFTHDKRYICFILTMMVVVEAGVQMESCLQKMTVLSMETLEDKKYYNDYTNEVLDCLASENEKQDYRINKQYFSYRYNDAWVQGYYGTSFYLGGVGVGNNIVNLYDTLKLPTADAGYKYAYGTSPYTEINTLLGVKYILNRNSQIMNYGYDVCYSDFDIYALENKNTLSWGYGYDNYISFDEYLAMDINSRRKSIVNACVVDESSIEHYGNIDHVEAEELLFDIEEYDKYKVEANYVDGTFWVPSIEEGEVLVIDAAFDLPENEYRAILSYLSEDDILQYHVRVDSEESQLFEINAPGTSAFAFYYSDGVNLLPVLDVECYIVPSNLYYKEYNDGVEDLSRSEMNIQEFSGEYISGSTTCDDDKIFCLAVPFGNWKVYVDGEEKDTFLVNMAFTGFFVNEGEHFIEAVYSNDLALFQNVVKYVILALCAIWIIVLSVRNKKVRI